MNEIAFRKLLYRHCLIRVLIVIVYCTLYMLFGGYVKDSGIIFILCGVFIPACIGIYAGHGLAIYTEALKYSYMAYYERVTAYDEFNVKLGDVIVKKSRIYRLYRYDLGDNLMICDVNDFHVVVPVKRL